MFTEIINRNLFHKNKSQNRTSFVTKLSFVGAKVLKGHRVVCINLITNQYAKVIL